MDAVGYFSVAAVPDVAGLRSQEACFYRYCDTAGLRPLATFSDQGPEPRPGFTRLVRFLERAKPGITVALTCLERLGGSPLEIAGRLLEIETLGARLHAIDDDLADPLTALLVAGSARKPAVRQDKARQQLQQKAMQAHGLGKPPFGYRIGPDSRFAVVPEEATMVQLIYRLYLQERMGLRLIAGHLNERGLTTRRGARWSVVTVRDILRNPVYQGTYSRFGVLVSGSHPPLVSRETFRRAQERRKAATPERQPAVEVHFALSGLVYCGYCGSRMVGATRRQAWLRKDRTQVRAVYRYYRCGSRVNQSVCGYHTHRADDLEAAVAGDVAAYLAGPEAATAARFHLARARALRDGLLARVKDALAGRMEGDALRQVAGELLSTARAAERAAAHPTPSRPEPPGDAGLPPWLGASPGAQRAVLQGLVQRVVVFDDHWETEVRDPLEHNQP
ncbi:MAG: recombinase family protein [Chloroflexi bacterium]|nr:recombinase family protein [Chloroflexota bacterium]